MIDDKQLTSLVEEYAKTFAALPLEVQENYLASLRLSFVHNTIAIEGNQASPLDAELLLKYKTIPQNISYQDLFDLVGQDLALARMREYAELKTLVDQDVICELHRIALYPTPFCQCQEDVLVLAGRLVPKAIGDKMKLAFWCYIFRKLRPVRSAAML